MSKAKQTKAIAFCRIATTNQNEDENNLQKQVERIKSFADHKNIDIVRLWQISVSGKFNNQKSYTFNEMLDYCKKHKNCKYLIVDDFDRISRSIGEYYYWKVSFQLVGVELLAAKRLFSYSRDSGAALNELISVYMAESSNEQRTQFVKDRMLAKMRAGYYPHNPHFGYKTSNTPGLHVPDSPVWNVLKTVFEAIADGSITVDEGYKWLKQNIVTGQHAQTNRSGNVKKYQYLRLLADPYYAGQIRCGDTTVNGLHEPLVSERQWQNIRKYCTERHDKKSKA